MLAQVNIIAPKTKSCWRRPVGLTLIEVLMAVAVLGVILAVAAPSISDLIERRRAMAVASEIANVLNYAKAEISNSKQNLRIRFDPDSTGRLSCVQVATQSAGNGTDCRCWESIAKRCMSIDGQNGGRMLRTFVNMNSSGVSFSPDVRSSDEALMYDFSLSYNHYGYIDSRGMRIKVEGKRGIKLRVEMNMSGRISVCAPDNDVAGYGPCDL